MKISSESFISRLSKLPYVPDSDFRTDIIKQKISEKYCIMPGHKQGYMVVTDRNSVAQMGKKYG
jgi:hypothetical protein